MQIGVVHQSDQRCWREQKQHQYWQFLKQNQKNNFMKNKIYLGPEPYIDPNPTFDDGLYDVYKYGNLPWCDERVIWAVENGAQGPINQYPK